MSDVDDTLRPSAIQAALTGRGHFPDAVRREVLRRARDTAPEQAHPITKM
jgi:hypothetical protein